MQRNSQSINSSLFFFSCLLMQFNILAQSPNMLENLKNVMPPSPNSSAFAKYGDWPVSLYTGVPNISVPVTTLKGRTASVPITLSYHAAGNKVGDIASWVGLGWSLSAGGVISRSIRGLNDEAGFYNWSSYYSNPDDLSSTVPDNIAQLRIVATANNTADSEQDTYNFSAMGRSYRLLLKADGSVLTIPHSNLKFVSNPIVGGGTEWTVLMEDGTKLSFGGGNNFVETTNNPGFQSSDGNGIQFISSWQLRKITTVNGEVVNFTYSFSNIDQDSYFSESDNIKYKSSFTLGGPAPTCLNVEHSLGTKSIVAKQRVSALSLSSIESDLQRIDFVSTPGRLDLEGGSSLSEIKVFSKQINQFIERYIFNTSYSQAVTSNELFANTLDPSYFYKRLRLNSFERRGVNDPQSGFQKWTFEYNLQNLPSRRSFAQDHWGYFNGAVSNATLLPRQYFVLPNLSQLDYIRQSTGFMPDKHDLGGNREGNSDFMQAEMLTKISYPTGGYSQFAYEPNSVPISKEIFADDQIDLDMYLTSGQIPFINSRSSVFTLSKPGYVGVNFSSQISANILNDIFGLKVSINIRDSNGTSVASTIQNGITWFNILSPGVYTFQMSVPVTSEDLPTPSHFIDAHASLQYQKSNGLQNINQLTGGLRVASIIDYDAVTGFTNKKYFQYSNPLVINSIDITKEYVATQVSSTNNGGELCYFVNTIRNSSTKFASGSIQGGSTGYAQVKALYGSNGENGYTISIFNSEPDNVLSAAPFDPQEFPYPPAVSRDNRRGLLLTQKDYNAQNVLLKQIDNTYSFTSKGLVIGYKAGYNELVAPTLCINQYHNCGIIRAYYGNEVEQVKHLTSTETTYDTNGQNPLVKTITNYFDNPINVQPVRTVTKSSKGEDVVNYSRTPLEKAEINAAYPLSATASLAIDSMVRKNMVSQVIQTENYLGTFLKARTTLNHKIWLTGSPNPTIIAPENAIVQIANNTPELRIQFKDYDAFGNLLEQQKKNDVPKSYLYDYNFAYPIAEVINASKDNIAYTSFEADGTGNWQLASTRDNTGGYTGNKSYYISSGIISKPLNPSTTYVVSFWAKNAVGLTVNGTTPTPGPTRNGWTFYQQSLTGITSVSLAGTSGNIDEVRLHPHGAQMTTYVYSPTIGVTSSSDAKQSVTYYEYDNLNRLVTIRDEQKKIIKNFQYHYKE
jgi:hypothetical protein